MRCESAFESISSANVEPSIRPSTTDTKDQIRMFSEMLPIYLMYFFLGVILTTPVSFLLMIFANTFTPIEIILFRAVIYSPWVAKPFIASLLDGTGVAKTSVIHTTTLLGAIAWLGCIISPSRNMFLVAVSFSSLVTTIADVALDSLMIERAHVPIYQVLADNVTLLSSSQIQAKTATWRVCGSAIGAFAGGVIYGRMQNRVLLFFSMFIIYFTFFTCSFLGIEREWIKVARSYFYTTTTTTTTHPVSRATTIVGNNESMRNDEDSHAVTERSLLVRMGSTSSLIDSLRQHSQTSLQTIRASKEFQQMLIYCFLLFSIPRAATFVEIFCVTELGFSSIELGTNEMIGYICAFFSVVVYQFLVTPRNFRGRWWNEPRSLLRIIIIIDICESSILVPSLFLRWYSQIEIHDQLWSMLVVSIRIALDQIAMIPLQGGIVNLCRGTHSYILYALFTALSNFAILVSMFLTTLASDIMKINSTASIHTAWKLAITRACLLIPFVFFSKVVPQSRTRAVEHENNNSL